MANKNVGMLQSLGLELPEDALFQQGLRAPNTAGMDAASAAYLRGQSRGQAVGGALATGIGALSGAMTDQGWKQGALQAAQDFKDNVVANTAGISVDELRDRRRVASMLKGAQPSPGLDPISQRMEMLDKVIKTSKSQNIREQAMAQKSALYDQQQRLELLKAGGGSKGAASRRPTESNWTIMDANGEPKQLVYGQLDADNNLVVGNKTYPSGTFVKGDQMGSDTAAERDVNSALRKISTPKAMEAVRDGFRTFNTMAPLYGRTMELLSQAEGEFGFLSTAGEVQTFADRAIANVTRLWDKMVDDNGEKVTAAEERKKLRTWAEDGVKRFGLKVPSFGGDAKKQELYRSWIISLAYLEARMMEPSNRGLSDADIENALERLNANSANPDVIMKTFAQKINDGYDALQTSLNFYSAPRGSRFSDADMRDGVVPQEVQDQTRRLVEDYNERFGVSITDDSLRQAEVRSVQEEGKVFTGPRGTVDPGAEAGAEEEQEGKLTEEQRRELDGLLQL